MADTGKGVFLDLRPDGLTAEGIARLFPPPLYFTAWVDGREARDKAALLAALAAAFKFPAYFGNNWDALLDCLRSLPEFNPAGGYVLLIKNSAEFLSVSAREKEDFLDVAAEAGGFLAEKLKLPFRVVFL